MVELTNDEAVAIALCSAFAWGPLLVIFFLMWTLAKVASNHQNRGRVEATDDDSADSDYVPEDEASSGDSSEVIPDDEDEDASDKSDKNNSDTEEDEK